MEYETSTLCHDDSSLLVAVTAAGESGVAGTDDDCTTHLRTEMPTQCYPPVIWQAMSDGAPSAADAVVAVAVAADPGHTVVVPMWEDGHPGR